jgi:hypothetical protein
VRALGQPLGERDACFCEAGAELVAFGFVGAVLADPLGGVFQRPAPVQARQQRLGGLLVAVDYVDRINRSFWCGLVGWGVGWFAEVGE